MATIVYETEIGLGASVLSKSITFSLDCVLLNELNQFTLKQDDAKKLRRSLPTTFSINRRNGRRCEDGAVL